MRRGGRSARCLPLLLLHVLHVRHVLLVLHVLSLYNCALAIRRAFALRLNVRVEHHELELAGLAIVVEIVFSERPLPSHDVRAEGVVHLNHAVHGGGEGARRWRLERRLVGKELNGGEREIYVLHKVRHGGGA